MLVAKTMGVQDFLITFNQCNAHFIVIKIEIVIENKVSVSSSLLHIGSHVPHFQCLKANLTIINLFFPTDMRHYQHYSHTNTVTNYHYISLPAIVKTVFRNVAHLFLSASRL